MGATAWPRVLAASLACTLAACAGEPTSAGLYGDPEDDQDAPPGSDGGLASFVDAADDPDRPRDRVLAEVAGTWPRLEAPDAGPDGSAEPGDASQDPATEPPPDPPADDVPTCSVAARLFERVNPEACDCAGCGEVGSAGFTLGARSRVLEVQVYARSEGLGGGSFGCSITAPDGTVIAGTMEPVGCHATMPYCFYGAAMDAVLDPGSYVVSVDWPRICSNPSSGGEGFVVVNGCTGS